MQRSKIPSPARSEGARVTPRRHRFRSSRSVTSPARSDVSLKLSSIVQTHAMQSPVISPLRTRRSVLSDNTDIEVPGRHSWWKRLEENSRDVMEVFENKTTEQPENIDEYIEADFKSQENDYTLNLPDSSDGESINSIVLPQRKFFSEKQTQSNKLFHKIIENRENLTHRKSKVNTDNTIFVGKKNFFNKDKEVRKSRPAFPPGLLNMTDKTIANKTQDSTKHEQVRNLLGNRAGTKRKNMFADFIMSESEEEIPDIQPNVFGFAKNKQPQRKMSSQGTRNTSPRSNETDLEFEDWQHLPSSTMVDELDNLESSPVKRLRLSKPDSVIEEVRGNVRNKLDKTKLTLIMSHGVEDDELEESSKKKHPKNTNEKTLTEIPDRDAGRPFIEDIIQVDSDDDNNFTLRYDNDDKNMQDEEIDVTVKEFGKDNANTSKHVNTTVTNAENVAKPPNSQKVIEPIINKSLLEERDATVGSKTINKEQDKNVSWKVLETYKEQAAINVREDVDENILNKNTSIAATNQKEVDEIDNHQVNISKNTSINKEKTNTETEVLKDTSITTTHEEAQVIQTKQNDVENIDVSKNTENIINQVEGRQEINNSIRNISEQILDNNDKDNTEPCTETHRHINVEENNLEDAKLNESKKDTVKEATILTSEERNKTICDENQEIVEEYQKEDNVRPDIDIDDKVKESDKETQQVAESRIDENIDQAKGDNIVDNNENDESQVVEDEHNDTRNKSLESKEASLNENILTDDEGSKHDDDITEDNETTNKSHEESNKMTSDDENNVTEDEDNEAENQVDEEDDAEESEIQNETNEESNNQPRVSSIEANIETDDEENPKDSDEEENDENDAEENEIAEENDVDDELGISSINKSNEAENDVNNEENDSDDGISDRIGMPSINIETDDEDNDHNNEEMNEPDIGDDSNTRNDNQVTLSKGRIYLTNVTGESSQSYAEESGQAAESDPEDAQTRRLALEEYLMKIKNDNIEKRRKIEEQVRNSLKTTRETFNNFKAPARLRPRNTQQRSDVQTKAKPKKITSLLNIENLPPELVDDMKYKPPRRYQPKSAAWITKRLYKYLETKLEPKYDYKARVKAEKLVETLYEFSKEVRRARAGARPAVDALKAQLARAGLVHTHYDFYNFIHEFMPREIRVKVIPDVVNEIPLPRHGVFSNIV